MEQESLDRETVARVLWSLTTPIAWVDNGCSHCVENFIESANVQLEQLGVPFRYEYDWEEERVTVSPRE